MRALLRLAALLTASCSAWGSYQFYVTDPLTAQLVNTTLWAAVGSVNTAAPAGTYMGSPSGSLISVVPIPDGTSDGEVRMTVNLSTYPLYSNEGATLFARATPNAESGTAAAGTYYAFEMQNPTFTGGVCSATYVVWKRYSGTLTALATWNAGCAAKMTMRLIVIGSTITVWYNNQPVPNVYQDSDIASGSFGVGGYGQSFYYMYLTNAQIGPADRIAPNQVSAQSIGVSAFPTEVDLHWTGTLDDSNGIGMAGYQISRNGVLIGQTTTPDFTDETVSASTTYTYSIASVDQHNNVAAATSTTLVTRPAGTVDPLRIGVRPTGSYWGAAGEQIDLLSGNLNFTLPLLKPQARGGWGMTVGLSYNSQMWRQDSGGSWLLGEDIGYGLGWHVQAASVRPVWTSNWVLDHYVYSDSSGAVYRLNQDSNGLWTSLEGVYVTFDQNANILHFNDGSFWTMGSESAGSEQDAGTMYPTTIEDTNGNQIQIAYQSGVGAGATNSSSRMLTIGDPRQVGSTPTYQFTYNSDAIPHLTQIASSVPGESYTFAYGTQQLSSPLTSASFGSTTTMLSAGQTSLGALNNFTYSSGGELTNYVTPMNGALQWTYQTFAYADGVQYRQVQNRYMTPLSGGTQYAWAIQLDTANNYQHTYAIVADQGAGTQKQWWFNTAAGVYNGLATAYEERDRVTNAALRHKNFTWATNSAGNVYVGTVATILNPGTAQVQTSTVQTLDTYGNVTQQQVFDYGNGSTPARTYNYTYLTGSNYVPIYIRNRLTQATVTSSAGTITQQTIAYDGTNVGSLAGQSGLTFYDANYGNWNSTTYRGNPTSVNQMGTTLGYGYFITGVPYQIVDGDGATISLSTSSSTAYSLPAALTPNSNSGLATNMAYASSSFALTSVSGPNGATQATTYDSYNRPSTVTSLDGAVTTYAYAYNPNTLTASLSSPSTQWTKTIYDGFGRTISVQSGHDSVTVSTVDTQYGPCGGSPLGVVSQMSQPYGPGETEVWTTYTYDGSCRRLTAAKPDGSATSNVYTGNSTKITDPAGKYKTYTKDAFGDLLTVVEPDPNSSGTLPTNYTYNAANQLTGVSMTRTVSGTAVTQTRGFTWSGSDLASSTNPENGTVTYTYDGNHHVTQRTDALGNSTNYSYDGYERLNHVTHSADYRTVTYAYDGSQSYDPCPNNYLTNAMGRLASVTFTNGGSEPGISYSNKRTYGYEYGYNTAGRVTQQVFLMNYGSGQPQSVNVCASYNWDNQGRPTSVTTPGGTVLNYQYDAVSRLSSISETAGGQTWTAASASYNSASLITSLAYGPNGSQFTENRTYNNLLQMTRATVTGSTGTTPMDMQYIFPTGTNNGKVSQTIDNVLSETVNYQYDALNRLITAAATNSTWGEAYSFDGFGNLQSKTPTVGSAPTGGGANPASNQPIGVTMDANGNNLGTSGAPNAWDTENHLFSSPLNGTQTYYDYDPWGKRVWKEVPPNSSAQTPMCEFYFYGLGGQKLETFNCTYVDAYYEWPLLGSYTSAGINLNFGVGGKLLQSKGAWVATDRQGSVRANSNGEQMSYFPYGEERTSTANDREKYGTYMRDGMGQDYAGARYYNSGNGAFWSPDPGGIRTANPRNPGSWNRYAYVLGDPVNNFDPTGRIACDDDTDDDCPDADGDPDQLGGAGNGSTVNATGALSLGAAPANPLSATVVNSTVTFPTSCAAGQVVDDDGQCDNPVNSNAQQVIGQAGSNLAGATQALGAFAAGAVVAGAAAAAGIAATADAAASSVLYGDVQASFNFGASVQPTITNTIEGLTRVSGSAPGESGLVGSWVSSEPFVSSAQSISTLSLPLTNPATSVALATIVQGANIVFGTAAPLYGQAGGGFQIFATVSCILFTPICP